jgi:hypothetical protein
MSIYFGQAIVGESSLAETKTGVHAKNSTGSSGSALLRIEHLKVVDLGQASRQQTAYYGFI